MYTSSICSDNFVLYIQTLRIIILTFNRPRSLHRVLTSLELTNYRRNCQPWELLLEMHVDVGGGIDGERVKQVAH